MEQQLAYPSHQPHLTTDGPETNSARSEPLSRRRRKSRAGLTATQEREIARMYRENMGEASEIARAYGISPSTVYRICDLHNVPRRFPSISSALAARHAQEKALEAAAASSRAEVSAAEKEALTEPASSLQDGPPIAKVRRKRRRKSWLRKLWDRLTR